MLTVVYILIASIPVLAACRKLLRLRKGDTPYCGKCGYNLTGLTSPRCPECGELLSEVPIVRGELVLHRSTHIWFIVAFLLFLSVAVVLAIK